MFECIFVYVRAVMYAFVFGLIGCISSFSDC